jgi:ABC-type antimicrobial peptide transport system ATPase subunit
MGAATNCKRNFGGILNLVGEKGSGKKLIATFNSDDPPFDRL